MNDTEALGKQAMALHDRLVRAYMDEQDKRDRYGHKTGDQKRMARLARLIHKAADRWRRIYGIPPIYDRTGVNRVW